MSKEKDDTNQATNNTEENSNIELIYSYTEAFIKAQEESLNRLDTKLSTFLAFGGVSLRFAIDSPDKSKLANTPVLIGYISLVLKIFACGFSILAIVICVLGLTAKMRGFVVSPETLMQDVWYWEENSRCKAFIVNTWIEASKEYKLIGRKKGNRLNLAIILICGAAITFALNTILLLFYT